MTTKFIKKQAEKAAKISFKNEKLDETVVKKFLSQFKGLPFNEAIMSLNFYLKALKRQISKHVLIIESAVKLSAGDEKSIAKMVGRDYSIFQTQTKLSPSLLGGFKVKIADTVLDLTLKEKLNQIRTAIAD